MLKPPVSRWRFAAYCRNCDYEKMFRKEFQRDRWAEQHIADAAKHVVELRTLVK